MSAILGLVDDASGVYNGGVGVGILKYSRRILKIIKGMGEKKKDGTAPLIHP